MKTKPEIKPRKPASVSDAAAFVHGANPEPSAPEELSTKPEPTFETQVDAAPNPRKKMTMNRKRSGQTVRQLTIYLSPETEKQLKLGAVEKEVLPSAVIEEALKAYFAKG